MKILKINTFVLVLMTLIIHFNINNQVMASSVNYKVEQLPSPLTVLGEGPHWDSETQNLYFNDIYGGTINRYCITENKTYSATVENEKVISFVTPVDGTTNEFAIGIGRRIGVVQWDGNSTTAKLVRVVGQVEEDDTLYKTNRFNDAKSDPTGRFYGGTMRLEECGDIFDARLGSLYRYTKAQGFEKIRGEIGVSNGLAWNEKKGKFYYIDSCDLDVKEFDYDAVSGNISNPRTVINFKINDTRPAFVPDGMTIDADGNLYVALWGGYKVLKINPINGEILLEIKLPCEQVTSAAFGGPDLDILFVTTAGTEVNKPQPAPAGALFKVTGLGVKGTKMTRAKV